MSVKAVCTWGEGPDVLVEIEDWLLFSFTENVIKGWNKGFSGSFDLTAFEAKELAAKLVQAAEEAERLEEGYCLACKEQTPVTPVEYLAIVGVDMSINELAVDLNMSYSEVERQLREEQNKGEDSRINSYVDQDDSSQPEYFYAFNARKNRT